MAPAKDLGAILKGIPPGAWVAIAHDEGKVIFYSADMQTVITKAKELGEKNPIIVRVSETPASLLL